VRDPRARQILDVDECGKIQYALAAGRGEPWSPTIRAAVLAGMPWLDGFCSGCRTGRALDIRTLDRHSLAPVGSLVLGLRCSWCRGSASTPVLMGLHPVPPAAKRSDTSNA
jgi:hypothetical protein